MEPTFLNMCKYFVTFCDLMITNQNLQSNSLWSIGSRAFHWIAAQRRSFPSFQYCSSAVTLLRLVGPLLSIPEPLGLTLSLSFNLISCPCNWLLLTLPSSHPPVKYIYANRLVTFFSLMYYILNIEDRFRRLSRPVVCSYF